jgi:hypothetical protein
MASVKLERPEEENPSEKIATSVYPPFAILAGMQLDLFTSLKNGPMNICLIPYSPVKANMSRNTICPWRL